MILAALALLGCPEPPDPFADIAEPLERECLVRHCTEAEDVEVCRAAECARHETSWSLTPSRIGYDGNIVFIEAAVRYQAPGWGDAVAPRESPVFAGVTLIKSDDTVLDLAVQTRFESDLEAPFFLSAEVGEGVEYVILGLWDHKVEPCESDRPGCKEFGFLLDGSLSSWPPTIYVDGRKRRIPPPLVPVEVHLAGADPALIDRAGLVASEALAGELVLFGATVAREAARFSDETDLEADMVVRYGHPGDALMAQAVADALAADTGAQKVLLQEREDDEARVDVVLVGPHAECLASHCSSTGDLIACFEEHCKG